MDRTLYRVLRASAAALLLCGCDGHPSGAPPEGDVVGRYLTMNGVPAPGAIFAIDGRTAITDAGGYFRFSQVPASYDLVKLSGENESTVYEGVTRRDPVVTYPGRYTPADRWAEITGRVPHSDTAAFVMVSTPRGLVSTAPVNPQTDAYFVTVPGGQASGQQRVTVQAIQYRSNLGAIAASRSVQVGPGDRVLVDFAAPDFTPLGSTSLAVRVSPAEGADLVQIRGRAVVHGTSLPFFDYASGSEAVLRFPRLPGLTVDVDIRSYTVSTGNECVALAWGVPPETTPIHVQLHHAPSQQAPADSAAVDWTTELSWSPGDPGGVFRLSLRSGDGSFATVTRYTNRLAIPIGEAAPSSFLDRPGWCTWWIAQTYAAQSVDELLQAGRMFEDNAALPATSRSFARVVPGAAGGPGAP